MSRLDAYLLAFLAHVFLAFAAWLGNWQLGRSRFEAAQRAAVSEHESSLRQVQAAQRTVQLRRMRELVERIAAAERQEATERPAAAEPSPTPPPAGARRELPELWKQSSEDFRAAREKLLELEAERLAELTKTDPAAARAKLAAEQQAGMAASETVPRSAEGMAEAIEQMHGEVQGRLGRVLQQARNSGTGISVDDARSAYQLAQTQQTARESRQFDPVVDWTGLMGKPLSTTPINGILDPEGILRQVASDRETELRQHFAATQKNLRFSRRIGGADALGAEWICPDAWYVIGPFENAGREAIDRTFPPEIEIDRDALYAGKDGKPVGWRHVPVTATYVIPPALDEYAIYYAFTEIHCERPIDCWLALGSDDHSKLWVNGVLVWSDSKNHKSWSATQGFRRVRLEAGFNRFLFRLENGWREAQFSVLISLQSG